MENNSTIIKETKQKYFCFDDLRSNTKYEVKIFIYNNIGYNSEQFLLINFRTKFGCSLIIIFLFLCYLHFINSYPCYVS